MRVILCEHEHADLPFDGHLIGQRHGRDSGGGDAEFLGELRRVFLITARHERQRRVVEVGQILCLPVEETGRRRKVDLRPGVRQLKRRRNDVAVREAFEVARDVKRLRAQRSEVREPVIAVARTLGREHAAHLPLAVRFPQDLAATERRRP